MVFWNMQEIKLLINKIINIITIENKLLFTFNYFLIILILSLHIILANDLITIILFMILNISSFMIFIGAIYLIFKRIKFKKSACVTIGNIVSYEKGNTPFNTNAPIVMFKNINNKSIKFHNEISIWGLQTIDKKVTVLYDNKENSIAVIKNNFGLWLKPIYMIIIFLAILVLDFILIYIY